MNLFKTTYLRNQEGQFVCGISMVKVIVVVALLLTLAVGSIYSIITAPLLNKPESEDPLTKAVEAAVWVTTGTQYMVDGNVIWDEFTGDTNGPSIYVGDDIQTLNKWNEWQTANLKKQVQTWQERAGEPTAILINTCRQNGMNGLDCPKTLYAMAQQESYFGKAMSGDGGRSWGFFHVMDYHGVPKSCSEDLACSSDWTLKRMIRLGFKTNPNVAIQKHNGTPNTPATNRYLALVIAKKALWPSK